MSEWDAFVRCWDYDFWANSQWLKCLEDKGRPEPDFGIFKHILSAQKIWLVRCNGESLEKLPDVEASVESMTVLCNDWKDTLRRLSDDPVIHYKRTTGEAQSLPVSEILRHVQNHGTYHRGELRGLCRSRGDDDFPETDRVRFISMFPVG